jgi:spermidine synthase
VREIVDRVGPLTLARQQGAWELLWEGHFLMSSAQPVSERALGEQAGGDTLIGGLGMGFTLRAALDRPATRRVDVVEIAAAVIAWNRGPLAPLAGHALADPRVRVHCADVAAFIGRAQARGAYDCILLDVDNGPSWTARPGNQALYDDAGLTALRAALRPGGRLVIWSAQPEPSLAHDLGRLFLCVQARAIPVVVGGRPASDWLYSASTTNDRFLP